MKKRKSLILFFIFIFLCLTAIQGFCLENVKKYKIGVLLTREEFSTLKKWSKTAQYLTSHIVDVSFEAVPLSFENINKVVKNNEVDFLILNPAIYLELESYYGVERLAIIKNYFSKMPYAYYGSAVFVKSDRTDIQSFRDLRWKNVAAVHPKSFGGWLMAYRAFKQENINPFEDFKLLKFGGTQEAVVYAVLEGKSDVGIVRTGVIEKMVLDGKIQSNQVKILPVNLHLLSEEEKNSSNVFPLEHSTRLYPEWVFAKTKTIDILLAEKVLATLLSIEPDHLAAVIGDYGGWTIPVSYQSVHDCLKELQVSPYDNMGKSMLKDVLLKYRPWVMAVFILFLFTIIFAVRSAILNKIASENSEKIESLLNAIPHAVVGLENRRILFANAGAEKLFGWPIKELKGNTTSVFYPDQETFENVGSRVHAHFEKEDSFTFEESTVRRDGTKIDALIIVAKMTRYTTENKRVVAIYQDISGIKKILAQIEQQKVFLNEVINSLTHPFYVIDANSYEIKLANTSAKRNGILEGQKCFLVAEQRKISCSDFNQICPLDEVKETKKPAIAEYPLEIDGKISFFEIHMYPILNEQKEVSEVIEYSFDITERKKAEEELKKNELQLRQMYTNLEKTHKDLKVAQIQLVQAEKLASIGQLAAGIAHEINNPTAFIYSNIGTLAKYMQEISALFRVQEDLKKAIDDKKMKDIIEFKKQVCDFEKKIDLNFILKDVDGLLKESQQGLVRVKSIVGDLRAFSRDGKEERSSGNVNEIMDTVLNIVSNELKEKADILKEYGAVPLIFCNIQQIGQVFMNVLINASQAIEKKGNIWIRTYKKDNFICVEIKDSGKGILPEHKGKIFDPFFTTKPVGQGTGLGLSISYQIVKKHNGDIFVESQVGKGSKFTVALPINESIN